MNLGVFNRVNLKVLISDEFPAYNRFQFWEYTSRFTFIRSHTCANLVLIICLNYCIWCLSLL